MFNYLKKIRFNNHEILGNIDISLINPKTNKPYSVVVFVGENGCGKTTILKELFNYNKSKYIQKDNKSFNALFLRQGSLHSNAMREIRKLIDSSDIYTPRNGDGRIHKAISNNGITVNNLKQGLSLIKLLGDEEIYKLFRDNHIDDIYCSQEVSRVIDGKAHGYDIANYSSGQQEILLKLKDIRLMSTDTDWVLLDEPETSLHPRWQLDIVKLIRLMAKDTDGNYPQIFLATHSEKVLKSLIDNDDTLIIRLFKDMNDEVKVETIDQMDLVLPHHTFAELDYVIFKIDSFEYCSELYDLLEWRNPNKKERALDTLIRSSEYYDDSVHHKEWFNERFGEISSYNIATYCRNYFHHPKDRVEPSATELHDAILLLRNILSKQTEE